MLEDGDRFARTLGGHEELTQGQLGRRSGAGRLGRCRRTEEPLGITGFAGPQQQPARQQIELSRPAVGRQPRGQLL